MRSETVPLPKSCIFCGKTGKLTREDFFPKWFRELYPATPEKEQTRLNAEVSWHVEDAATGDLVTVTASSKLARPGDLADQTLRIVCASCNNGWMSRLQQAAKVHLMPYIIGQWSIPHRDTRQVIASWATMFAMVVEFGDEPSAVVPPIEREVFARDLLPPLGAQVMAGRLAGDLPYWFHRRALRLTANASERRGHPNAQLTTIVLGHLLLQVYLTTSDLQPFDPVERAIEHGLWRIWPLDLDEEGNRPLPVRDEQAVRDFAYRQVSDRVVRGIYP